MQESSWSQSSGAELTDVWPLEGHLPWHKHVARWCKMLSLKNVENALGAPFRYTEIVIQSGDFFMSLVRAIYRWKSRQIMLGYGYMHIWYMATYIFICNMYRYILTHVTTMAFVNEYIYIYRLFHCHAELVRPCSTTLQAFSIKPFSTRNKSFQSTSSTLSI